ncbi:437_t:CDS:2 [Ambispora gerdemannii]|uniref:437_t:CDS:1 n=1 Tax=Ambispora gerdemannii TaxID=144530 RepID=A0A9N9AD93_9GLOM|nr:437_t:CDS:2 [Ambispora gerdemannii]
MEQDKEPFDFAVMFDVLLKISMVVGPVVGYFDQIATIRNLKSSAGFSIDTCGVLLISSTISAPIRVHKISISFIARTKSTMVLELALGIESTVPMPQAWKIHQSKTVAGFRGMLGLDTSQLHERLRRSPSYNSLDEIL